MPNADDIRRTKEWAELDSVIDVREHYRNNGSEQEIMKIVALENRKFGSVIEKLLREIYNLSMPESTKHDAIFVRFGRPNTKLEIKAARYWAGTKNCKWQHLEPDYDYTHILFVLVDFNRLRVWCANKTPLFEEKILTPQGKQGYWGDMDTLLASGHLTEVRNEAELFAILP